MIKIRSIQNFTFQLKSESLRTIKNKKEVGKVRERNDEIENSRVFNINVPSIIRTNSSKDHYGVLS